MAFGMAERLGIIEPQLCKLLLTTVAISMAATPALSNFSAWVADQVCVFLCGRGTCAKKKREYTQDNGKEPNCCS